MRRVGKTTLKRRRRLTSVVDGDGCIGTWREVGEVCPPERRVVVLDVLPDPLKKVVDEAVVHEEERVHWRTQQVAHVAVAAERCVHVAVVQLKRLVPVH